jgi:hypothetical protein
MSRTLGDRILPPRTFWILFTIFVLPIVIKFNWPNARDSAVYADAFSILISGENPYEGRTFRAGLFGSSLFALISALVPQFMEATVFIILGISGLVFFIKTIFSIKYRNLDLFALVVIVWSSANRESLNTIQITGVLLALISISIFSIDKFYVNHNKSFLFVGSITAAIAIDLKPHLVLPSLILILFARRCYEFAGVTSAIWLLAHLVIDLFSGRSWTLVWFEILSGLASSSPGTTKSDFIGFWSIISTLFGNSSFLSVFPYMLILVVLIFSIRIQFKDNAEIVVVGFSISLFTTYTHYYDYVPIIAICVITLLDKASGSLHYGFLGIIVVSQNIESTEGLSLVLAVLVVFFALNVNLEDYASLFVEVRRLLGGLTGFLILHWFFNYFTGNGFNQSSISAFCILLLCWIVFIRTRNTIR